MEVCDDKWTETGDHFYAWRRSTNSFYCRTTRTFRKYDQILLQTTRNSLRQSVQQKHPVLLTMPQRDSAGWTPQSKKVLLRQVPSTVVGWKHCFDSTRFTDWAYLSCLQGAFLIIQKQAPHLLFPYLLRQIEGGLSWQKVNCTIRCSVIRWSCRGYDLCWNSLLSARKSIPELIQCWHRNTAYLRAAYIAENCVKSLTYGSIDGNMVSEDLQIKVKG